MNRPRACAGCDRGASATGWAKSPYPWKGPEVEPPGGLCLGWRPPVTCLGASAQGHG